MAEKEKRETTDGLYCALMEEMKIRLRTVDTHFLNQTNLPGTLVRETCYLQLRMCCELLAISCLVACGEIEAFRSNKFRREYNAEKLLKRMEGVHGDFFPHPGRFRRTESEMIFDAYDGPVLKKDEVITIYNQCGGILHRGSLRDTLSRTTPLESRYDEVRGWLKKFWDLLVQHRIAMPDRSQIIVQLENGGPGNPVGMIRTAAPPQQ